MAIRYDDLPPDAQQAVDQVRKAMDLSKPIHDRWRANAEKRYALYRSYQDFKGEWQNTQPNDVDDFWMSSRARFGRELFIPYAFTIVETTIPRMLSHRPKMLVLPRDSKSDENVENIRLLLDAQQEQIQYELILQQIAKTALIYGLGLQKVRWKKETVARKKLRDRTAPQGKEDPYWVESTTDTLFDDPTAEWIDPFDFFWSPNGYNVETLDYGIHRTWRTKAYVRERIEKGDWENITVEELEEMTPSATDHAALWDARDHAGGYGGVDRKKNELYEVLEYWDRRKVITTLSREIPVVDKATPYWHGDLPFQAYRPTEVPGEFPGIGVIEPMEDLQYEINALRTQRRDNATLVLNKPFAYWDGLVDPDEVRFAAGSLIPVPGDPRDLIRPLDVGDIPASGYQEEAGIQADIERVSGISDPVAGADSRAASAAQTATGAQLIQQAASIRIQNMTRRMEAEIIAPGAKQFILLDQQKIRSGREVRTAREQSAGEGAADQRWAWFKLGPKELRGNFDVIAEGGATAPENPQQEAQTAQMLLQMFGNIEFIDQEKIFEQALRKMGLKDPKSYIRQPEPPPLSIDPNVVGQLLVEQGMDPNLVQSILQQGQAASEGEPGQGEPPQNGGPPDQQQEAPVNG